MMTKTNDFEGIKLFLTKIDVSKNQIKENTKIGKRFLLSLRPLTTRSMKRSMKRKF